VDKFACKSFFIYNKDTYGRGIDKYRPLCYNINMKEPYKLYIVRKYIKAKSAKEAIMLDKKTPVDDVWVDEEFKKTLTSAIGFDIQKD